jgi:hypothetical protein
VTVNRWRLGCVDLYVGQEVGLRQGRGNKKEPRRFSLFAALCGAWPFKKLLLNFEREFRLKRRNHNMSLFLSSRSVKDNRKILLCKKKGRGCGNWRFRHMRQESGNPF